MIVAPTLPRFAWSAAPQGGAFFLGAARRKNIKLFPILALALGVCTGTAHAVQDCELNGQSVNPANGNTTAGKTGLMRCKDRDSGVIQREQELKSGVFRGLVRFYEQGKLAKEHSVNAKGNMDGLAREFSPSGQVVREATYDNGRTVGLVRSFYSTGQLRRASFHEEPGGERAVAEFTERGQLSALRCADKAVLAPAFDDARPCGHAGTTPSAVELFDGKGVMRSRLGFTAGKRVRAEEFYDNGQPSAQMEQSGNQRIERRFSSEGVKRREVVSLLVERGTVRQREAEFSERGTLVREQRWTPEGEAMGDDSYYLNGQPRSKAVYSGSGDTRVREVTEYFDNGQRAAQGRYSAVGRGRQLPTGTHQRFNEQGRLVAESTFDAQGRVTRERTWGNDGQLQRDDEVFEDGSRKAYAK